jgi:hypothetical protein
MDSNQTPILLLRPPEKGSEMRERTAVKVARFVPRREGKSNLSFLFNRDNFGYGPYRQRLLITYNLKLQVQLRMKLEN